MTAIAERFIEKKPRRRVKPLLPLTLDERMDLLKPEIRVDATLDEYFALAQNIDYNIHYSRGQIVSFIELDEQTKQPMGEVAHSHERMVARIIALLANLLEEGDSEYEVYGSNAKVYIENAPGAYNPDITITKGAAIIESIKSVGRVRRTKVMTNPKIIVEILSPSTRDFDKSEKLADYKKLQSVEQIIFVEQKEVYVQTYIKESQNRWLNLDFFSLDEGVPIVGKAETLALKDIYKRIIEVQK
jgi:Uma2 family endonuclease